MSFHLSKVFGAGLIVNKNTWMEYNTTDCIPLLSEIGAELDKNSDLIYQHKVRYAEILQNQKCRKKCYLFNIQIL